jgi:predicted PurR-regulated permease PerM
MLFLLVLGAFIAGFWGLLLAGPVAATAVEIYRYVCQHYKADVIEEG